MSHRGSFRYTTNRLSAGDAVDWRELAVCGDDPDLHYPVSYSGAGSLAQVEQAKARCRRCPVKAECLQWAVETGDDFGVLGGTTPDERRAMKHSGALNAA